MKTNNTEPTHVLVPIEWLNEQKERGFSEYAKADNDELRNIVSCENMVYSIILKSLPHINPDTQQEYISVLEQALDKIANPIKHFQIEAEKIGAKLDSVMAIQLAKDANYLSGLAKQALQHKNK